MTCHDYVMTPRMRHKAMGLWLTTAKKSLPNNCGFFDRSLESIIRMLGFLNRPHRPKSAQIGPHFPIDLNLSQRDPRLVEMPKGSPRGTLRHLSSLGRAPALPRRHKRAGPPSEVAETGFRRD